MTAPNATEQDGSTGQPSKESNVPAPNVPASDPSLQGLFDVETETTPTPVNDIMKELEQSVEEPATSPEAPKAQDAQPTDLPPGVERSEDGTLTWKVPGSPEGTLYKGKDLGELMGNVAKGIAAKDEMIAKAKSPEAKQPSKELRKALPTGTDDDLPEVTYPNRDDILRAELAKVKEAGVTPEMLSWGKQEWRAYEDDEGSLNAMLTMDRVNKLVSRVDKTFTAQTIEAINTDTLNEETRAVESLLQEYGIDPDSEEFNYDKVLKGVYENESSWKPNGVRKTGVVVKAAARAISKVLEKRAIDKAKAEAESNFANSRKELESLVAPTNTAKGFPQESRVVIHKSLEAAKEAALREINENRK